MTRFARKMIAIEPRRRDRGERPFAVYVLRVNRPPGRPRGPASVLQRRSKVTTLTPETLAELERLLAEWPGPWEGPPHPALFSKRVVSGPPRPDGTRIVIAGPGCPCPTLIVALRNAAPALVAGCRERDRLRAKAESDLREAGEIISRQIQDSCDLDAHVQSLCRKAGMTESEITGDGYAVPVEDLVDRLAARLRDRAEAAYKWAADQVRQDFAKNYTHARSGENLVWKIERGPQSD